MKKLKFLFLIISLCFTSVYPQKVGLVLSGGGAKGITHIGVLKALEENDIPIDYIAGTSMGAIVGGMYAMVAVVGMITYSKSIPISTSITCAM